MFFTYVLFSESFNQIYIGQTSNLDERLASHNSGLSKSTKRYLPWKIIYFEEFSTRSQSMKREKELKSSAGRKWVHETLLDGRVRRLTD